MYTWQNGGALRQWIRDNVPYAIRSDARNIYSGNAAQKVAGIEGMGGTLASGVLNYSTGMSLPDLGVSEIAGSKKVYDLNGNVIGNSPDSSGTPPDGSGGSGGSGGDTGGNGGSGGDTGGGDSSALQNYLDLITSQSNLLGQQYQQGIQDTNSQYIGGVARARGQATQGVNDINSNLADYTKTSDQNLQKTNQSAGQALANTEMGMRNNYASRGALDSTFYSKSLRNGLMDIKTQQNDQVNYITEQLNKAKTTAQKQKDTITNQLYDALNTLQQKKEAALKNMENQYNQGQFSLQQLRAAAGADVTKFATPQEIQNLAKLQTQSINIDDMINQIDTSAKNAIGQIQTQNSTAVNTNMDMTNVQNLLTKLGQGLTAGVRKVDFIPMLTANGYSPEEAQALLDKAETYASNMAISSPVK